VGQKWAKRPKVAHFNQKLPILTKILNIKNQQKAKKVAQVFRSSHQFS
jgi:hypothetical protein